MDLNNNLNHIKLDGYNETHHFTSTANGRGNKKIPLRNREIHSRKIYNDFITAWNNNTTIREVTGGVYLEFNSSVDYDLMTNSLENMRTGKIRLCNIKEKKISNPASEIQKQTSATIFIPNGSESFFLNKIDKYSTSYNKKTIRRNKIERYLPQFYNTLRDIFEDIDARETLTVKEELTNEEINNLDKLGLPEDLIRILEKTPKNYKLIETIENIKYANAMSLWTDDVNTFPGDEKVWCEIWLKRNSEDSELETNFIKMMEDINITVKEGSIIFPERVIKLIHANKDDLQSVVDNYPHIAEFRLAMSTARFWIEMTPREQAEWSTNILERLEVDSESLTSICILDHGINNGHPLLAPVLIDENKHSVESSWGTHDHHGHGTMMAGIATYGNISNLLEGSGPITINHIIESSKVFPPGSQENPIELWGYVTKQGVYNAEIQAPYNRRIICMASTSPSYKDRGEPSSWSAAIDQLASGSEDDTKRLVILSAGNYTSEGNEILSYPDSRELDTVQDPAQAWNAISVGAYTNLTNITEEGLQEYSALADAGELSPFTTTSFLWDRKWPIKPDVVFEGGNLAVEDSNQFYTVCDDLSLLTTNHDFINNEFTSFGMTSAATAQAANFAAIIQSVYPNYWPETIRALIIHSARWSEGLINQYKEDNPDNKIYKLLKASGYGIPDIHRALYCGRNSLTLVAESEIQPYEKVDSKGKSKDMHLYKLPWPASVLEELGHMNVEMRITLSYFIEPGPEQIGWTDRYRYPSHLLRFDINSPGESESEFLERINREYTSVNSLNVATESASRHWVIGANNRDKGSIHSDIWKGTAAQLASSNMVAIFPRIGWWRERLYLGNVEKKTRYSLIVSIQTPEEDIDIYTPVQTQIAARTTIEIPI